MKLPTQNGDRNADTLTSTNADDALNGFARSDKLDGLKVSEFAKEVVSGGVRLNAALSIEGDDEDNELSGTTAAEASIGGAGDDTVTVNLGSGNDTLVGGDGCDGFSFEFAADPSFNPDTIAGIEDYDDSEDSLFICIGAKLGVIVTNLTIEFNAADQSTETKFFPTFDNQLLYTILIELMIFFVPLLEINFSSIQIM